MRRWLLLLFLLLLGYITSYTMLAQQRTTANFYTFDVWINSAQQMLNAYQLEISYNPKKISLVGIEGGAPLAFRKPPYYDRRGFRGGKIILAAFSTRSITACGKIRVARIHIATTATNPKLFAKVIAACSQGNRIKVRVELSKCIR